MQDNITFTKTELNIIAIALKRLKLSKDVTDEAAVKIHKLIERIERYVKGEI